MWRDWTEWYGVEEDKILEWDVTDHTVVYIRRTVFEWIVMITVVYIMGNHGN
jgi:hypothetical protein